MTHILEPLSGDEVNVDRVVLVPHLELLGNASQVGDAHGLLHLDLLHGLNELGDLVILGLPGHTVDLVTKELRHSVLRSLE